jgi:uncharacterized protein YuzE
MEHDKWCVRGSDDSYLQLADVVTWASLAEEQQAAEQQVRVERDLEAVAKRGTVPRGYGLPSDQPLPLVITYDPDTQVAYIRIGQDRELRRGGQVRLDRGVAADFDTQGRIAGIEITGVLAPEMRGSPWAPDGSLAPGGP